MLIRSTLLVCLIALSGCSFNRLRNEPSRLFILKGARLIDGKGGSPIENSVVVIQGSNVVSIQRAEDPIPETQFKGAEVVDLKGKTIMPALISAHAHLGMTNGTKSGSSEQTEANVLRQMKKYKKYGVGVVTSLGTDQDFIYELRDERLRNEIDGPRILTAGRGFGIPEGAPPIKMGIDQVYRPTKPEEVKAMMDVLAAKKPNLVKIWVDDFGHEMKSKMDPMLYEEIIREAHARGLKVAAHVYYLEDAKRLAKAGVDLFAHSIRDKKIDTALIALMKKNKIGYIPTLALDDAFFIYADGPSWMNGEFFQKALDPGMWEWFHTQYQAKPASRKDLEMAKANVRILLKAGIPIGMGTDSGATVSRIQGFSEHRELELLVSAGLTPMQAIRAATEVNAQILGTEDTMGSIVLGTRADLLILNANPLENILNTRNIHSVWLDGVEVAH